MNLPVAQKSTSVSSKSEALASWAQSPWLFAALLVVATFLAYYPAWNGQPVWDDNAHITKPELRSLHGLVRIWVEPGAAQQYYPLAHTVFWIEHRLWGDTPIGYHLLTILLHLGSALLLWKILRELKIPGSRLAVVIFALHPIQVESVAWISELKNTLSGAFFFGSVLVYLAFDRSGKRRLYALALGLFICGLLSKTAIAPMPAALLAILWWKHGSDLQWGKSALRLAPFLGCGLACGLFTSWMERHFIIGPSIADFRFTLIERMFIAGRAFWFYLEKIVAPVNLMFIYPRWNLGSGVWQSCLFCAGAVLLFSTCRLARRHTRAPLAALLYFAFMLSPALGFVNIYPFRFSFVADHFQYLAGIGPIVLIAGAVGSLRLPVRKAPLIASLLLPGVAAALLGIMTFHQSPMYADEETLFQVTLEKNPDCWMAHNNLAQILAAHGHMDEAFRHCRLALELKPDYMEAQSNMGTILLSAGRTEEAIAHFRTAVKINPDDATSLYNLGSALAESDRAGEGIEYLQKAVKRDSANPQVMNNLGLALMKAGRSGEAVIWCGRAQKLMPDDAQTMDNLSNAYVMSGRIDSGMVWLRRALATDPYNMSALKDLSIAFMEIGRVDSAIVYSRKAQTLAVAAGQDALAGQIGQALEVMQKKRR